MTDTRFVVRFDGYAEVGTTDLWPNGDGPEDPTAEDVKGVWEQSGWSKATLLGDLGLLDNLDVFVARARRGREVQVWDA